jgi:U3 small nucleolar RNA-associated protein MPP10
MEFLDDPTKFLGDELYETLIKTTKTLFEAAKEVEPEKFTPLSVLYTEGFDIHGIWNQINLLNQPAITYYQGILENHYAKSLSENSSDDDSNHVGSLIDDGDSNHVGSLSDADGSNHTGSLNDGDGSNHGGSHGSQMEYEEEMPSDDSGKGQIAKKRKKSVLDDEFFSLEEMERFADLGESHDIKMTKRTDDEEVTDSDNEIFASLGEDLLARDVEGDENNANGILK